MYVCFKTIADSVTLVSYADLVEPMRQLSSEQGLLTITSYVQSKPQRTNRF